MIINHRDGTSTQILTQRPGDEQYRLHTDIEMEEAENSLTMRLPDGTWLIIHHFPGLGSGVSIYDDLESNPVVSYDRSARR